MGLGWVPWSGPVIPNLRRYDEVGVGSDSSPPFGIGRLASIRLESSRTFTASLAAACKVTTTVEEQIRGWVEHPTRWNYLVRLVRFLDMSWL